MFILQEPIPFCATDSFEVDYAQEKFSTKIQQGEHRMEHLIVFPIGNSHRGRLRKLMDDAAKVTGIAPPYLRLPPHVSVCSPLSGINERALVQAISEEVAQARQTRMTIAGSLFPFGKHYIVCPVHTTLAAASLWSGILARVSRLSGYEADEHEGDNTLHATIAARTSEVFDAVWPTLEKVYIRPMTIPLKYVVLYRKLEAVSQNWKRITTFSIPA